MNLLSALPQWFTSWGWIVVVVAAVVIIAIVVVLIVRSRKDDGAEEYSVQETETAGEDDSEPEQDESQTEESAPEQAPAEEAKESAPKPVNKTYHVAKRKADGKWQVKIAGGSKAIKLFATQLEAIDFAKKLAENQEAKIVIHKEDGTFRRLTYHKKK